MRFAALLLCVAAMASAGVIAPPIAGTVPPGTNWFFVEWDFTAGGEGSMVVVTFDDLPVAGGGTTTSLIGDAGPTITQDQVPLETPEPHGFAAVAVVLLLV